jgi:glutaredoxin
MASSAGQDAPLLRLEVVSKVGCVWCDRLKAELANMTDVEWFESACLDPATQDVYNAQREALLARCEQKQTTFPFVFDADSGALIGGHDATLDYIEMHRLSASITFDTTEF